MTEEYVREMLKDLLTQVRLLDRRIEDAILALGKSDSDEQPSQEC